jgi:threonine dehydrogenase-like Zn-dependent dehydrogenase
MAAMSGHRTSAIYGYSNLTGGIPGGQSDFVRVPLADVNCLPIPDELPDEKALFLTDILPTSYHAAKISNVSKGDVVAIWGMGPVGLLSIKWCQLRGVSQVIGIDCVPERLRKARELGADTINYADHNVITTIKELYPDGVDVAIECVGGEYSKSLVHRFERALNLETDSADIFSEMFQCVRPFGRVSVIGVYLGYANHFPVGAMMEKGLTIRGGQAPVQRYWKKILKLLQDGAIDPTFLITHRGDLSKGPEFYKAFVERKEGIMKVFMRPEATSGKVIE